MSKKNKEDWDVNILKETSEDNVLHKEKYPMRGSKYFFGFNLKIPFTSSSFSKRTEKKGNKRIFYYR